MPPIARTLTSIALVGVLAFGAGTAAHAQYDNCGFHPVDHRRVALRRPLSCAEAKRVLLRLKDGRDTVPMVCVRPRVVQGWRLKNHERQRGVIFTDYRRGRVSFQYQRVDHFGRRAWCPPKHPPPGDEHA